MTYPDTSGLPVNIDTTYADSGTDATVKAHQQHHDTVHDAVKAVPNVYAAKAGAVYTGTHNFTGATVTGVGGAENVSVVAPSGSAQTLTLPAGGLGTFDVTLTAAAVALTFAGAATGTAATLTLLARQDGTGGRTITWPGSVTWVGGSAPLLSTAAGAVDVLTFLTVNGGTTWYGFGGTPAAASGGSGWRGRATAWIRTAGQTVDLSFGQGAPTAAPIDAGAVTIARMAVDVRGAAAGALVRLGLYADDDGKPGGLLIDAGTVDASTAGVKETTTFSQAVTGRVWAVMVPQGSGSISLRAQQGQWTPGVGYDTASNALGFTPTGYTSTDTVTGALPATFTMNNATTSSAAVAVKVV